MSRTSKPKSASPFRYFNCSPELIRLLLMSTSVSPLAEWQSLIA